MYLSLLCLDFSDCRNLKALSDYDIHRLIYKLFPGQEKRCFLYYIDHTLKFGLKILIQSEIKPEPLSSGQLHIKEVPDTWFYSDSYMFRIRISPVIRKEGKAIGVVNDEYIEKWFAQKASNYGFSIMSDSLQIVYSGEMKMHQTNGNRVSIHFKDIVGILKVTDERAFVEKAIKKGIGQGKGFGCGLLQLQKINKEAFI